MNLIAHTPFVQINADVLATGMYIKLYINDHLVSYGQDSIQYSSYINQWLLPATKQQLKVLASPNKHNSDYQERNHSLNTVIKIDEYHFDGSNISTNRCLDIQEHTDYPGKYKKLHTFNTVPGRSTFHQMAMPLNEQLITRERAEIVNILTQLETAFSDKNLDNIISLLHYKHTDQARSEGKDKQQALNDVKQQYTSLLSLPITINRYNPDSITLLLEAGGRTVHLVTSDEKNRLIPAFNIKIQDEDVDEPVNFFIDLHLGKIYGRWQIVK